jgi:pantetheine-phosphate adenylyltransferase
VKKAVYFGTFDPVTLGHINIIQRAASIFDELHVVIATNTTKKTFFSLKNRLAALKLSCKNIENVCIASHNGLAVTYAEKTNIYIFVRGLRTETDYIYEMQISTMNSILNPKIETIFIPTLQKLSHISSSLVKEIAKFKGDVSSLVPKEILDFF